MRIIGRYESVVENDQYLISIVLVLLLEAAVLIPMRDIFGVNDPLNKLLSKELYVLLLACSTFSLARQSIFDSLTRAIN